jgi:DNA-3-methyladenine glycosylase
MAVDRGLDGEDLVTSDRLWLAREARPFDGSIARGSRIGVAYAGPPWAERPWRFGLRGSPYLSRPFPDAGVS